LIRIKCSFVRAGYIAIQVWSKRWFMDVIESGKTVLHRGREAPEILEEETAELNRP
jgi:hypothetical protein